MKKIFALAMLVASRLATAQSFSDVDDSTYNSVHLSADENEFPPNAPGTD